jgi:hypothetical protein
MDVPINNNITFSELIGHTLDLMGILNFFHMMVEKIIV